MAYNIKISQFCAISQEIKFHVWLSNISTPLYEHLLAHFKGGGGGSCRANTKIMAEIHQELQKTGKHTELIKFLQENYPQIIESRETPIINKNNTVILATVKKNPVFKHYNAQLLTFPQKAILYNKDINRLSRDVKRFISDKLDVDYIIIGDRAYIEYFKYKYRDESGKIHKDKREIYQYRLQNGIQKWSQK